MGDVRPGSASFHRRPADRRAGVAASVAALLVAATLGLAGADPVAAGPSEGPTCGAPGDLVRLHRPLPHVAGRLASGAPLRILALGSSSTLGLGASSPAASYPSRLEAELRRRRPGRTITVLNRGVAGNETHDMMLRFDRDVLAEKPDLVIWQVGTNTLLNGHDMWSLFLDVRAGIRRLRAQGADVLLMNVQYSPRVLARPTHEAMMDLVAVAGRETDVDVFDRFRVMRHWAEDLRYGFDVFVTADGLHMNDWGYACVAELLAEAIDGAGAGGLAGH